LGCCRTTDREGSTSVSRARRGSKSGRRDSRKGGAEFRETSGENQSQSDARDGVVQKPKRWEPKTPKPEGCDDCPVAGAPRLLVPVLGGVLARTADGDKGLTDASSLMTDARPALGSGVGEARHTSTRTAWTRWIYKRRWCPPPEPIQIPHSHSTAFLARPKTLWTTKHLDCQQDSRQLPPPPAQQHLGISNTTSLPPPTTTATPLPSRLTPRRTLRTLRTRP